MLITLAIIRILKEVIIFERKNIMEKPFQGVFEPELTEAIKNMSINRITAETTILKDEAYIQEIPLLLDGRIKVRKMDESGKEIVLYYIEPGESCILSITSCLNNKPSHAEAITQVPSEIIAIPANTVKEWMDLYKSWRSFVMNLYYSRLNELLTLVDRIAFKQTDFRLLDILRSLRQKHGNELPITHQQLAYEVGTAREVISRLLKQLEKNNFISLSRGKITILRDL